MGKSPSSGPSIGANRPRNAYTTTACDRCRRKRAKCDGRKPRCTRCISEIPDEACIYSPETDKRKPPSQALVQGLRDRISELEELLEEARQGGDSLSQAESLQADAYLESGEATYEQDDSSESDADDLALRLETQLVMTEPGVPRTFGPISQFHMTDAHNHAPVPPVHTTATWTTNSAPTLSDLATQANFIASITNIASHPDLSPFNIPMKLHYAMLDAALTWQTPFMEWVESEAFLRDMVSGTRSPVSAWSPMLHLTVMAIGAKYIHEEILAAGLLPQALESAFVAAAKKALVLEELQKPSLAVIRATICLASIINSTGDNRQGWLLLGLAVRMSEDSGLHLDCKHLVEEGSLSEAEAIARNKAFWTLFSWSMWLGRPSNVLPGRAVSLPQVLLPEEYNLWHSPNRPAQISYQSSAFREMARVSLIVQDIMKTIYSKSLSSQGGRHTRKSLDVDLFDWHNRLPGHLRITSGGTNAATPPVLLLHLHWCTAVILLHRPAFFDSETPKVDLSTSPQMTGFVLGSGSPPTSQQKCAAAAKEVLHIAQIYDEAYGLQRSCQTVSVQFWLTGTIFLLLAAQQGQMQNTATVSGSARRDPTLASRQLLAVVEYLKKAGRVWGECFKSADVLTKLHEDILKSEPQDVDARSFHQQFETQM